MNDFDMHPWRQIVFHALLGIINLGLIVWFWRQL